MTSRTEGLFAVLKGCLSGWGALQELSLGSGSVLRPHLHYSRLHYQRLYYPRLRCRPLRAGGMNGERVRVAARKCRSLNGAKNKQEAAK